MSAQLSLLQAAAAAGVNKTTILRKAKKGTLSATEDAHGNMKFHIAELQRVYPNLKIPTGEATGSTTKNVTAEQLQMQPMPPTATIQLEADYRVMQVQLEATIKEAEDLRRQLREEKTRHDETRQEKAEILGLLGDMQKRIPELPAPVAQLPVEDSQPKRGLWARFTGKAN